MYIFTTNHATQTPPRHKHETIHVQSRFHFYNHTSCFKGFPFKWCTGNFNRTPFAFLNDLRPRLCHACPGAHPMDVISFVSHCPTCEHLVQTYIQCCRPPFTTVVSKWWSTTTHVGERRSFVRGLVPMSLYTQLTTPPAHCHDLTLALTARVPLLLNALYRTLEWLNNHHPPIPLTPSTGPNPWGAPGRLRAPHKPPSTAAPHVPPPLIKSCTSFQTPPPPLTNGIRFHTPDSPLNPSTLCR